ncbi:MAG: hypothetical protein AC479_07500 [miscellaneous Crenarchaeota group-6 archaeon AD8-1]|nr:MAG: hypothetical protein AC479_07500 [miscellaneous Crenarchaeota group-6 archaeon AD8-1]
MIIEKGKNTNNFREKKMVWIQPTSRDKALHKMADLEVLNQLAKRKYSIYIIKTTPKINEPSRLENSLVHIISIPLKHLPMILPVMRTFFLLFLLPVQILTTKLDFIIEAPDVSILSFIPILILSKMKKVKLILDIRTVPVETIGFRGFMLKFWFVASIIVAKQFFDGITIITSSMKKEICTRFHINPKKVGIWTSGVSLELFDPFKYVSERLDFKSKLGLSEKFVVFYHGVFTNTRGLTQTIEAMKILQNKYPDVILFLLGRGPIASNLRSLIRENGLQNNVIIHDAVDQSEVPKFISMCNVGIVPLPDHPHWRHQSPLKLLEYLAMKKVVILTDIPAHRAVIGKNECGLYISSIKPIEIAEAIENAYMNKLNLESWGRVGREIVREKYTWEKVAVDLENYLLSIE